LFFRNKARRETHNILPKTYVQASLEEDEAVPGLERDDTTSKIYRKIVEFWNAGVDGENEDFYLEYSEVESRMLRLGFTREQLNNTLDIYSNLNSLAVNQARTKIRLLFGIATDA